MIVPIFGFLQHNARSRCGMNFLKFSLKKSTSIPMAPNARQQSTGPQLQDKKIAKPAGPLPNRGSVALTRPSTQRPIDALEKKGVPNPSSRQKVKQHVDPQNRTHAIAQPNVERSQNRSLQVPMPLGFDRMDVETFNAYLDETERQQGLTKIVTIGFNNSFAPYKQPTLMAYGMSDLAFLKLAYDCMMFRDQVEHHLTAKPESMAQTVTVLDHGQTMIDGRSRPSQILHRMSACEPLINDYLAKVINPSMQRQRIPLHFSTRTSDSEGVMLCASVIRYLLPPDAEIQAAKPATAAFESIPNLGMIASTIAGVTIYSQGPTMAERQKYQLSQDNNTYIGDDPKRIPYHPRWQSIGLSEAQFFSIFEDLHRCVAHHLAHPSPTAIWERKVIVAGMGPIESIEQQQLFDNISTVIAQNQARPEICRILDHYNIAMIKQDIPLRLMALDFGHPDNNATHMGGHMLALYTPRDLFKDTNDRFNFQLLLTQEAIASTPRI